MDPMIQQRTDVVPHSWSVERLAAVKHPETNSEAEFRGEMEIFCDCLTEFKQSYILYFANNHSHVLCTVRESTSLYLTCASLQQNKLYTVVYISIPSLM